MRQYLPPLPDWAPEFGIFILGLIAIMAFATGFEVGFTRKKRKIKGVRIDFKGFGRKASAPQGPVAAKDPKPLPGKPTSRARSTTKRKPAIAKKANVVKLNDPAKMGKPERRKTRVA